MAKKAFHPASWTGPANLPRESLLINLRKSVAVDSILQRARIGRSRHNVEDVVSCSCVPREAVAFQATE